MNLYPKTLIMLICGIILPSGAFSQEQDPSDMEEAAGLPDTSTVDDAVGLPDQPSTKTANPEQSDACQILGYGRLLGRITKLPQTNKLDTSIPDIDVRLAGQCASSQNLAVFWDGHGNYIQDGRQNSAYLDQGGLRYRPTDSLVVMAGKERNRRAPGLIISPSDFLHSSQSMPGLQEERRGIWAIRGSWQSLHQSVDLFLLPVRDQRDNGLPDDRRQAQGAATRYFHQFANFDLDLGIGQLNGVRKAGISSQGYVSKAWKMYGEAGYDEERVLLRWLRHNAMDFLVGSGYEGSKFALRLEYLRQGAGLRENEWQQVQGIWGTAHATSFESQSTPTEGPAQPASPTGEASAVTSPTLLRQNYLIANGALLEWPTDWNIQETVIYGLDDDAWMNLLRIEYLFDNHQTLGLTQRHWDRSAHRQFFMRPADWDVQMDWKWSF